jgi:lipopolysaccharide transport system ATP-binding protein
MRDAAVRLEGVSKVYRLYDTPKDRLKEALDPFRRRRHRDFYALNKVDLEVRRGEILGVVGRNGSGKSTLLKLIAGVIPSSLGRLTVNGHVSAMLELGSGLNPGLNGIQNIYFGGLMLGFSPGEMKAKTEEIIGFADIGDFIRQPLRTYSSGMKARLGFALAISLRPEILVVDEVLSVGDELFKRKCFAKMEELFKSGCTVVFVSHSMANVVEICTRAILLDRGEIILEGLPKMVVMHYQKYLFVKQEEAERARDEIIRLNHDEKQKLSFAINPEEKEAQPVAGNTLRSDEQRVKPQAYFIPHFVPRSTVITKNYDVDIEDIHIRTLDGQRVNVLMMNEEYIYSFKVRFQIDAQEVGVGVPFKTERGLLITNYTLWGAFIDEVKKGSLLSVDCRFKCIFLPGVYYATAEVGSVIDGERVVLNRIADACAFKVEATDERVKWGGIVYCGQYFDIKIEH